jgi:hypothetical protein
VEFVLTNSNNDPANAIYYNDGTANEITVNFLDTPSQVDTWTLTVTAYHTNYPDGDSDSFTFSFDAEDPCADATATTITLDTAAIVAAWTNTQVSIFTAEDYAFNSAWATSTTTGPTGTVDCGAFEITFTLETGGSTYLTDDAAGTATVDFAGTTSAVGSWTLNVFVRAAAYNGATDPVGTYAYSLTAFDPCDDADALTMETTYINALAGSYDLFATESSYTWVDSSVATGANAEITTANCGALVVSLAVKTGPADLYIDTSQGGTTSYDIWGSDPSDVPGATGATLELEFTAYLTNYQAATTKTASYSYSLTNTCAGVTLTAGDVYENNVVTTDVLYENGKDDVVLTFDEFTQSIAYCPVVYTVHLLTADADETEVTWNRESNPLVGSPYAYDVTPDSDYSSNAKSSEYLSIVRPDGGRGTITISNTGALDTFVGSYFLELRAHHQGVTTTKRLTHVGFNCDITIGYDTTTPIVRYLSTNPATT